MGSFLDLTCEGVGHPGPLVVLRLVVPDLLLVAAVDLGNDELDVFRDEFALLPRDGLTLLCAGPDLRVEVDLYRKHCKVSCNVSMFPWL